MPSPQTFVFTAKQQDVLEWYDEHEYEAELTMQLPTGFGKTVLFTTILKNKTNSLIVFPTLSLIDQFYKKYHPSLQSYRILFICSGKNADDNKELKNGELEYLSESDILQGEYAKNTLKNLPSSSFIIITTYASFPFTVENMLSSVELTIFDEAHHRGDIDSSKDTELSKNQKEKQTKVQKSIEKHRNKLGQLLNMSATPSDCCGGELYKYSLYEAIQNGDLRDFTLHTFVMSQDKQDMLHSFNELAKATKNTKSLGFTALSESDKVGTFNVTKFIKQFKSTANKYHIQLCGITGNTHRKQRREIINAFSTYNDQVLSLLVSCKTLSEGVDIPNVNNVIFIDPSSSIREIIQRIGRATRLYRDENGQPLPHQPPSSIVIPIFVDTDKIQSFTTPEEHDAYIRELTSKKGAAYERVMNVVSALQNEDEYFMDCLYYPQTPYTAKDRQQMDSTFSEDGETFVIESIPKDGNCFFHTLNRMMPEKSASQLRQEIADYIENNIDNYRAEGVLPSEIARLRQEGTWDLNVMDVVPHAAAQHYGLRLRIHTGRDSEGNSTFTELGDEQHPVHNVLLSDNHYEYLRPQSEQHSSTQTDSSSSNTETERERKRERSRERKNVSKKFRGHISERIQVLWNFNQTNTFFGTLEHSLTEQDKRTFVERFEEYKEWCENENQNQSAKNGYSSKNIVEKKYAQWLQNRVKEYKKKEGQFREDTEEGQLNREALERYRREYPHLFPKELDNRSFVERFEEYREWCENKNQNQYAKGCSKNETEKKYGQWLGGMQKYYKKKERRFRQDTEEGRLNCQAMERYQQEYPQLFPKESDDRSFVERFEEYKEWCENENHNQSAKGCSKNETEKAHARWLNYMQRTYNTNTFTFTEDTEEGRVNREAMERYKREYPHLFPSNNQIFVDGFEEYKEWCENENLNKSAKGCSKNPVEKTHARWLGARMKDYKAKKGQFREDTEEGQLNRRAMERYRQEYPQLFPKESDNRSFVERFEEYKEWCEKENQHQYAKHGSENEIESTYATWLSSSQTHYKKNKGQFREDTEEGQLNREALEQYRREYPHLFPKESDNRSFVERFEEYKEWCENENLNQNAKQGSNNETEKRHATWLCNNRKQYNAKTGQFREDTEEGRLNRKAMERYKQEYPHLFPQENHITITERDNRSFIERFGEYKEWCENENQNQYAKKKSNNETEKKHRQWLDGMQKYYKKNKRQFRENTEEGRLNRQAMERYKREYPQLFPAPNKKKNNTDSPSAFSSSPTPSSPTSSPSLSESELEEDTSSILSQSEETCRYHIPTSKRYCKLKRVPGKERCKKHLNLENEPKVPVWKLVNPNRGYTAPNPRQKDEINTLLKELSANIPSDGDCIVLDDVDFKSAREISQTIPIERIRIPQRKTALFEKMRTDSVYGSTVTNEDLLKMDIGNRPVAMLYADLMGSIKEAVPILDKFKERMARGSVLAVTISCRDGSESEYTNQFMSKLIFEITKRFPKIQHIADKVYGEGVRMGTFVGKLS